MLVKRAGWSIMLGLDATYWKQAMSQVNPLKAVAIADIESAIASAIQAATGTAVTISISSLDVAEATTVESLAGTLPSATINMRVSPVQPKDDRIPF